MKSILISDLHKLLPCFNRQWIHHFCTGPHPLTNPCIIEPFCRIEEHALADLYTQAYELAHPPINEETFYIRQLPTNSSYQHSTLVFYLNGRIACTSVSTNQLIEGFLDDLGMNFNPVKYIAPILGYHHKIPIIVGPYCFAPDRGTSKQNANWIALHHVCRYQSRGEQTIFSFNQYHELITNLSKEAATEMVQKGTDLMHAHQKIAHQWFKLFCGPHPPHHQPAAENILSKTTVSSPLQCSATDIFKETVLEFTYKVLKETLGEGNPYLDDLDQCLKEYGMGKYRKD